MTLIAGCAAGTPAPVRDRNLQAMPAPQTAAPAAPKAAEGRAEYHEVQKGETLFSIAFQHGIDYRDLAQWNGLDDPNVVRVGERLRLTPAEEGPQAIPSAAGSDVVVTPLGGADAQKAATPGKPTAPVVPTAPVAAPAAGGLMSEPKAVKQPYSDKALAQLQNAPQHNVPPRPENKAEPRTPGSATGNKPADGKLAPPAEDNVDWIWPTKGKPRTVFTESSKGIDIPGARGQAIIAAAPGKVIHVGANLRGYGKLVIIQHSSMFLSAYAHNNQVLVKEGERVAKGQKIAEMGDTDTDQVKLHFEIRRFGKPVDPAKYLPGEKSL